MNCSTAYIQSPLGMLRLTEVDGFLTELLFEEGEIYKQEISSSLLANCKQQLDEFFIGKRKQFDLPLSPKGTHFQQDVWKELTHIGYGETISYMTLSKRLGNPKAIRAVGAANGKNPIAIIIPCHRVVGSQQNLVGYSGGLWRKKELLNLELKHAKGVQSLF